MGKFDKKLANILVKRGLLRDDDRQNLLKDANGKSFTKLLLDKKLIDEQELVGAVSAETNLPPINLSKIDLDRNALELMDESTARSFGVLPIACIGNTLTLAVADPSDVLTLDHIQIMTHHEVVRVVASETAIEEGIERGYKQESASEQLEAALGDVGDFEDLAAAIDVGDSSADDEEEFTEHDNKLIQLVNKIIIDAYRRGASDIHIEPYIGKRVLVRARVDGDLLELTTIPYAVRNAIVSRIKIMSDLDIAERRKPQDGKIKFRRYGPLDIELRVATVPTIGECEDVVMRILAAGKPLPLDKIGMSPRNFAEFQKLVQNPYGIILSVGPTGSGKTTTLHSALGFINKPERKIWTAEDPVEITQEGLRQVQINRARGVDFSALLRSFLRADPDVIMVGEMRDLETTSTGIEASLTGHLVFSTLHTNNAPETVTRLLEMGIDEFSFADALLGVLAQRLMRTTCKSCHKEIEPTAEDLELMMHEYGDTELFKEMVEGLDGLRMSHADERGCSNCNNTGFRGRYGLHELLVNTPEIKDMIYRRAKASEIRKIAVEQGMRTLKQDGVYKVLQGVTTLQRVREVCIQ